MLALLQLLLGLGQLLGILRALLRDLFRLLLESSPVGLVRALLLLASQGFACRRDGELRLAGGDVRVISLLVGASVILVRRFGSL
jgi:hypothetical protein